MRNQNFIINLNQLYLWTNIKFFKLYALQVYFVF